MRAMKRICQWYDHVRTLRDDPGYWEVTVKFNEKESSFYTEHGVDKNDHKRKQRAIFTLL